jgi:hypothetical protein
MYMKWFLVAQLKTFASFRAQPLNRVNGIGPVVGGDVATHPDAPAQAITRLNSVAPSLEESKKLGARVRFWWSFLIKIKIEIEIKIKMKPSISPTTPFTV